MLNFRGVSPLKGAGNDFPDFHRRDMKVFQEIISFRE